MQAQRAETQPICPICLSKIKVQANTEVCSHLFCHSCILKWSKTQNTCPVCKLRFTKLQKLGNQPKSIPKPRKKQPTTPETENSYQDSDQEFQDRIFGILEGRNTRSHDIELLKLYCFLEEIIQQ